MQSVKQRRSGMPNRKLQDRMCVDHRELCLPRKANGVHFGWTPVGYFERYSNLF